MREQQVLWTVLPRSVSADGETLEVSVLVSPRLTSDGGAHLGDYPDFWADGPPPGDWPATVRGAEFHLSLAGSTYKAVLTSAPDSARWRSIFDASTVVEPFTPRDLSRRLVLSYSTRGVRDYLRALYAEAGLAADDDLPGRQQVSEWLADLEHVDRSHESLDDLLEHLEDRSTDGAVVHPSIRSPRKELELFSLFHRPPSPRIRVTDGDLGKTEAERATWTSHQRAELPDSATLAARAAEFHATVAACARLPELARQLGLLLDLEVHLGAAIEITTATGAPMALDVHWEPATAEVSIVPDGLPRTRVTLAEGVFAAAPRSADFAYAHGMLRVERTNYYEVMQVDVDGAAMKVLSLVDSLRQATERETADTPAAVGLPSLRSAGFALVSTERGAEVAERLRRTTTLEGQLTSGGAPPTLWAEDLVRGARPDVWDDVSRSWRSLCQRLGRYEIAATGETLTLPAGGDEGTVQVALTTSPTPADPATDPLLLSQAAWVWRGWSLCAPRPGQGIGTDDQVAELAAEQPAGLPWAATFAVEPGSLPRLRFGRSYRMRARAVDLTGFSLPPSEEAIGDGSASTAPATYVRYEPVPSPVLALVADPVAELELPPGESVARLVIRSYNEDVSLDAATSTETTQRHLVPPRGSQILAEAHGRFDTESGRVDPSAYAVMTARDGDLASVEVVHLRGDPPVETRSAHAAGPSGLTLPYLPDPLARGVSVRFYGHPDLADGDAVRVPFLDEGDPWFEARPLRLRIAEVPGVPRFVESADGLGERLLLVPLPKAARVRVRLSCYLEEGDLELLGLWQWMREADLARAADQRDRILEGRHWMFTPWIELLLEHAVQQPVGRPLILNVETSRRRVGSTGARTRIETRLHAASTQKMELMAAWNEPHDDPATSAPENRERTDFVFDHAVQRPDGNGPMEDVSTAGLHALGDTRYRKIEYRTVATSRYRREMPEDRRDAMTRESEPFVGHVESSARPLAPTIRQVLPTFRWEGTGPRPLLSLQAREEATSTRLGGGLRVYLDRPWFSSGYGEMLGVVLPYTETSGARNHPEVIRSALAPYVTQWAADPIWGSGGLAFASPTLPQLPLARTRAWRSADEVPVPTPATELEVPRRRFEVDALPLAETGDLVSVAPHDVFFDEDRRLWAADIQLDFRDAYFPFVRLALARYQPFSAFSEAHLSPVVLADFTQLAPDRTVAVERSSDTLLRVAVHGPGYLASAGSEEPGLTSSSPPSATSVFRVAVEELDASLGEDFGWKDAVGAEVTEGPESHAAAALQELWNGLVSLPSGLGEGRFRLVVEEYEEHLVEPEEGDGEIGRRLVFAEILEL